MELLAYILLPVYVIFLFIVTWVIGELYYQGNTVKKYLLPALSVKLFGALAFALVYTFYYGGGDTFIYFESGLVISEQLSYFPSVGLDLLLSEARNFNIHIEELLSDLGYFKVDSTLLIVKIISILSLFAFKNYFLTTLLYAFLCFWGQWGMFRVFTKIFPKKELAFFLISFCIPSVVFWCGGILKDTLMISMIGFAFYASYYLFFRRERLLSSSIILLIALYTMWLVKFYIPLAFIPALFLWGLWQMFKSLINPYLRAIMVLTTLMISFFVIFIIQFYFSNIVNQFVDKLFDKAIGFQAWHGYLDQKNGGSGYSLGEIEFTILGIIKKFPAAVNVTFFRPYLWEVNSIVVLIAAIETLGVTFFTFWQILKTGFFNTIRVLFSHPFLFFCLCFSLIFGFFVGFTSYNFGALVRYKTPCLPFFLAMLYLLPEIKNKYMKNNQNTQSENLETNKGQDDTSTEFAI